MAVEFFYTDADLPPAAADQHDGGGNGITTALRDVEVPAGYQVTRWRFRSPTVPDGHITAEIWETGNTAAPVWSYEFRDPDPPNNWFLPAGGAWVEVEVDPPLPAGTYRPAVSQVPVIQAGGGYVATNGFFAGGAMTRGPLTAQGGAFDINKPAGNYPDDASTTTAYFVDLGAEQSIQQAEAELPVTVGLEAPATLVAQAGAAPTTSVSLVAPATAVSRAAADLPVAVSLVAAARRVVQAAAVMAVSVGLTATASGAIVIPGSLVVRNRADALTVRNRAGGLVVREG